MSTGKSPSLARLQATRERPQQQLPSGTQSSLGDPCAARTLLAGNSPKEFFPGAPPSLISSQGFPLPVRSARLPSGRSSTAVISSTRRHHRSRPPIKTGPFKTKGDHHESPPHHHPSRSAQPDRPAWPTGRTKASSASPSKTTAWGPLCGSARPPVLTTQRSALGRPPATSEATPTQHHQYSPSSRATPGPRNIGNSSATHPRTRPAAGRLRHADPCKRPEVTACLKLCFYRSL
jgi:hypothetical protein